MQLIGSCVISFTWVSFINTINEIWLNNCWLNNLWVVVAISILLSIIFGVIFSKIFVSSWFHKFTVSFFGITPHNTVWRNIADGDSAFFKVYLKGKDFYWAGSLYGYEENGSDSWFSLHKPVKYSIEHKMLYNQGDNEEAYLVFNIKDVESIEIFR